MIRSHTTRPAVAEGPLWREYGRPTKIRGIGAGLFLGAAVLFSLACGPSAIAAGTGGDVQPGAKSKTVAGKGVQPQVAGFRSARFGMSKAEVLEAVKEDFGLEANAIATEANHVEKTTSLVATVPDMIPGAGLARVVYIHGYKTEKLIQVNVLWGAPVDPAADPGILVTTANMLRDHFAELGFPAERTTLNARIDDSTIVVFRGIDEEKRMVLLRLINDAKKAEDAEEERPPVTLWLAYIEDTENPDIYTIKKGEF